GAPYVPVAERRRAAGLCQRCGKHAVDGGRLHCEPCLLEKRRYMALKEGRQVLTALQESSTRDPYDKMPVTRWVPTTPPKATHIAGYVPPAGSIARSLLGHVIR